MPACFVKAFTFDCRIIKRMIPQIFGHINTLRTEFMRYVGEICKELIQKQGIGIRMRKHLRNSDQNRIHDDSRLNPNVSGNHFSMFSFKLKQKVWCCWDCRRWATWIGCTHHSCLYLQSKWMCVSHEEDGLLHSYHLAIKSRWSRLITKKTNWTSNPNQTFSNK